MMTLGMFVFGLSTLTYQELQRQTAWRHNSTSRIGAAPARQFLGRGDDSITLPGVLLPELCGSLLELDTLRAMADTGKAYALIASTGVVYGQFVIESLSETRTLFFSDGTPRRVEFSLTLQRVDTDQVDLLGSGISTLGEIIR
jgi:phage protein U